MSPAQPGKEGRIVRAIDTSQGGDDAGALRAFDSESHQGYVAVHRANQLAARYGDPIRFSIPKAAVFLFERAGATLSFPQIGGQSATTP